MSQEQPLWGIDLGGTKIEGVIMDPNASEPAIHRLRKPTPAASGYQAILSQITSIISDLEIQSGMKRPEVIGIGTPGAINPATKELKNSNTTCLNGQTLKADLSAALGCQLAMENDANCFALAEAVLGSAKGSGTVIGLILGTGVGSGVVVNGHVMTGLHGIAGEWGHNPIPGESHLCYCGRKGCVETVLAGPSLERYETALPASCQLRQGSETNASCRPFLRRRKGDGVGRQPNQAAVLEERGADHRRHVHRLGDTNARPKLLAKLAQGEWQIVDSTLAELSSSVTSRMILAEIP